MKLRILIIAICIACGMPMATHAERSGYVEDRYSNGGLHTFISTFDDYHPAPWEYICSNSFEDMELAFSYIELEFDTDSEDERDGYSYVNDCEVVQRVCASGQYIYSFKNGDGVTEYACKSCPAAANNEKPSSYSGWDVWSNEIGDITDCFIPSSKNFTDDNGTYKYSQNCYYKK